MASATLIARTGGVDAVQHARGGRSATAVTAFTRGALRVVQAAVAVVLFAVIAVVLAGVLPTYFGAESFTVLSGSMEPHIHVGALAVVRPAKVSQLKPGDVLTYRLPTQPDVVVTHRLIAIEKDESGRTRFRTKGDANSVEDLVLVDEGAVLGKVDYTVPYLGYLIEFSKSPRGRSLFVVLPALLLILDFLRSRLRRQRAVSAPASAGLGMADADRLTVLLTRGQQALEAGHPELAMKAADGVLATDARSVPAWLLKARATSDPAARRVVLQTALTLNPGADALAQELASLERQPELRPVDRPIDGSMEHSPIHDVGGASDAAG